MPQPQDFIGGIQNYRSDDKNIMDSHTTMTTAAQNAGKEDDLTTAPPTTTSMSSKSKDGIFRIPEEASPVTTTGATFLPPPSSSSPSKSSEWAPVQANFPVEDETYPFLDSITTMRAVKGYVNDENLLPTTTYSFMASTHFGIWSTKLVNIFVLSLQLSSYIAVTVSVIDWSADTNKCDFPANVTSPVRATQLLSMIYSILVQDGIVKALYTFRNGFNEEAMIYSFPDVGQKHIKTRWYISLMLILSLGMYGQVVTFIMIMQSETVLTVLLNYSAVNFIATVDDRIFYLGKRGFLGRDVERQVRAVALADNPEPQPYWYKRLFHSLAMAAVFVVMLASWITIVGRQTSGTYLPKTLTVEFSDFVHAPLGTFSGFYDIVLKRTGVFSTSRALYYERRSERAFIGYCADEKAWAFSYDIAEDEFDACHWVAMSAPTNNFDVVTTSTSQWVALIENDRIVPLVSQEINRWTCDCGPYGTCVNTQCECDDGYFGRQCRFSEPCEHLETDSRLGPFQGIDRKWSSKFSILRIGGKMPTIYDYPVYVSHGQFQAGDLENGTTTTTTDDGGGGGGFNSGGYDVIFFTGRRWALAFSETFTDRTTSEDLESFLAGFHAYFSNYTVAFLSEPSDRINEYPSPDRMSWFLAEPKKGPGIQAASAQQVAAVLMCTECNATTNPCFYDGTCQADATCKCSEGSAGGLCEGPPIGNGRCDPFFNTITRDFDGGDCCRATCVSSKENICGRDPTGFLDLGFFFCESDEPLPSEPIMGEPFSEAGKIIAFSANGNVLAAVIDNRKIGVFDKAGAKWEKRMEISTCPIQAIDMASGPFSANIIFLPPVVIAVSCISVTSPGARTYFCDKESCVQSSIPALPEDMAAPSTFGDSIGISDDGAVIAVSTRGKAGVAGGFVNIFRVQANGQNIVWGRTNETIVPDKTGRYFPTGAPVDINVSIPTFTSAPTNSTTLLPVVDTMVLEVETAMLVNTRIATTYCPCSGDGYADLMGQGASLEWNATILESGPYTVSVRYATLNPRPTDLYLDGIMVGTFDFEATPSLFDWSIESQFLNFTAGSHTLMIRADNSTGPNVDSMLLELLQPSTNAPTLSASDAPSMSPTVIPDQMVVAMTLSGSGEVLALVVGDILDGLTIRIYIYRFVDGSDWIQVGTPIEETVCSADIATSELLRVSHDGDTFLFSSGNMVKVFDWVQEAEEWQRRGDELEPSQYCRAESIALSIEGNVVAINVATAAANQEDGAGADTSFAVATFAWSAESSKWVRREQARLPASEKGPLALASGGLELVIGKPFGKADLTGGIESFEYPRRGCDPGYDGFRLTFTIKPLLTRWTLQVLTLDREIHEFGDGPYFFPNFPEARTTSQTYHELATVVEEVCIPHALCGNLTVYPTNFGGFNVVANGELILEIDSADQPISRLVGQNQSQCESIFLNN